MIPDSWAYSRCFISHERRFCYIEVPKVACTSIKAALLPLFSEATEVDSSNSSAAHYALKRTPHQISKRALVRGYKNGEYGDYFRFSFVRNPWDRLLSCYYSKIDRERVRLSKTEYEGGTLYPRMPFEEFAEVVCNTPDEDANMHFRSQRPMLVGPAGGYLTSFVGRFESLTEDFEKIRERLGPLELPHANPTARIAHREAYDARLRDMVAERYAEDIEDFGYEF